VDYHGGDIATSFEQKHNIQRENEKTYASICVGAYPDGCIYPMAHWQLLFKCAILYIVETG